MYWFSIQVSDSIQHLTASAFRHWRTPYLFTQFCEHSFSKRDVRDQLKFVVHCLIHSSLKLDPMSNFVSVNHSLHKVVLASLPTFIIPVYVFPLCMMSILNIATTTLHFSSNISSLVNLELTTGVPRRLDHWSIDEILDPRIEHQPRHVQKINE